MTAEMSGGSLFHDTIFALSSGLVPSAVAIIRVSGGATRNVLKAMGLGSPEPRQAVLREMKNAAGDVLDRGLVLFFPAPKSFTGEDCAEFHLHGGRAVVAAMLKALGEIDSLRPAEAGEFTRRAFLNGKMDLAEAEALSDLVAAETDAQRRFALSNGRGRHRVLYEDWRGRLITLQARIEADLDFSDQEDVPEGLPAGLWRDAVRLNGEISDHIASYSRAEIIRNGFQVVILGAPNAGKSSLLNTLARREVAIVTDEAGTTRDVLEVGMDIDGLKVVLSDTAGLRDEPGKIEAIGIEKALERAGQADLVLMIEDAASPGTFAVPEDLPMVRIGNKCDLAEGLAGKYKADLMVSAKYGTGIDSLLSLLHCRAMGSTGPVMDLIPFRSRHVRLLEEARRHLGIFADCGGNALELAAEELRLASGAIGRISGVIGTEDVLDAVFSQFCIGK